MRRLLLILLLLGAVAADAAAPLRIDAHAEPAVPGALVLRPNPDALAQLRVELVGGLALGDTLHFAVAPQATLGIELGDGGPTRVGNTPVPLPGLVLRRADGATTPPLALQSDDGDARRWRVVDADGNTWLRITQAMRSPDGTQALRLLTADLRGGPQLAAWLDAKADGLPLANAELALPLRWLDEATKRAGEGKSCAVPNWPGTPGFVTDVILTNIDAIDVMRCRNTSAPGLCDGPGGAPGEVVIVPSVTLRNSSADNASEVPWRTKFSGLFPPYGNDQHPFLVWNLYRFDADGGIAQIARSGLKHAFATANDDCVESCPNPHILGRGCSDLYNSFSNDSNFFLSPRREVIPSRGVWGRCGSVFDDGLDASGAGTPACDGAQDAPPQNDNYRERMRVREDDIDPALHPGARYFIDSWYVVRDDENLFNTMGSRGLAAAWTGTRWDVTPGIGATDGYHLGSVLERWAEHMPAGVTSTQSLLDTPEGRVLVVTRVRRQPDERWRYDYAIFNYDLTRPVTEGAEPNLRVLRNFGISAMTLPLMAGAVADSHVRADGDANPGNDWAATVAADGITWQAPDADAYLAWGSLATVRIVSIRSPGTGQLRLAMAEAGTPASYSIAVPAPDAAQLFRDGFD